jgi:wobble nucleotide-excising tRNase
LLRNSKRAYSELNFQEKERLDYFVNYDILFDYINNQGKESEMSVSRAIRPILEGYLRFSYPKNFPQNKWLGDYIEDIRNLSTEPYNTLKKYLRDIEEFNAYYKKYHHTQGSVPAIDPIELKTYAKRVLEFCSLQGK